MNPSNEGRSLGKTINQISRNIHWMIRHELDSYNVGSGQHFFLLLVHHHPGITQNEVSRKTGIDKASASKGLARLEQLGYLARVPGRIDRRVRRLYLTGAGTALIPAIKASLRLVTEACSAELTEEELEELFRLLDKVEHSLIRHIAARKEA
jgi:DNA-binding MarR family transcriptional regulator